MLSLLVFSGCRKDRLEDYTGTYTATRAGHPDTFTIQVRDNITGVALESTFGTFASSIVLTGTFYPGRKKDGSTAKLFSEVEATPMYHTGSATETNIGGFVDFTNRRTKEFTLRLSLSPCSPTEGGLGTEVVEITTQ
ncbi:MAG: hypothetical protein M3R08_02110 [Bacteroidota bacterium]|nr:hypothetical protein [Bacteroidota bacterium]